jgi:putative ABC transport system permease protein
MRTIWQDIRYGIRMLRKAPGFTAIALVTLAVGIGANTIMFSISDMLLLRQPNKVNNAEQLAYCAFQNAQFSWFRYSEYLAIHDSGLAFSDIIAQTIDWWNTLVYENSAKEVKTNYVSTNYFSVLGVTPVRGRGFLPEEERKGSAPVVVLSYRCWQRMGSNPKLIGQFVSINGTDCQVVGIAPKDFTGVTINGPDLWLSLGSYWMVDKSVRQKPSREPWLEIVGRLKPGLTIPVAQAQLQTLFPQFKPECFKLGRGGRQSFDLHPPGRFWLSGDNEQDHWLHTIVSLVLMGAAAIILIIACLNLANMLIVQGASRHREIAVRLALGGGRWRIIQQLLIESGLLALLGGSLGVLLAFCGMRILNVWFAAIPDGQTSPLLALNVRILVSTLGLCLIATLLFGLRPALLLSNRDIAGEMKASAGRVLGFLHRKRGGFSMAGQVALAVALVLSAALLTHSALQKAKPDPRFCLADKLVVQVDPESAGYDKARSIQACEALADHLASLPQVKAVGTSFGVFFGGGGHILIGEYMPGDGESGSGRPLTREAALVGVGRDYFKAMEIPLLRGRFFDQRDSLPNAEKVAIIDESLARKLRPDGNALDCFIQWGVFTKLISEPYRVVGVVAHLPGTEGRQVHAQIYTPTELNDLNSCLYLHVTKKGSMDGLRQRIAEEIHRVDPHIPVLSIATLAQKRYNDGSVWLARFGARLGLAAGAAALFLAALGIYAIKSYIVASRTSEIGIRMALGATHGSIISMVLREEIVQTMAGLIVGLLLGLGVAKVSASMLYGISPVDPVSILVTVALLGTASLLAGYLPARRAAKIDPMEALRYE